MQGKLSTMPVRKHQMNKPDNQTTLKKDIPIMKILPVNTCSCFRSGVFNEAVKL